MPTPRTPHNHHRGVDPRSSSHSARVTRRRALGISGLLGLTGALAACGASGGQASASTAPTSGAGAGDTGRQLAALLNEAPRCTLTEEETQGPYRFDVDSIRGDIREDRPGMPIEVALRVQDVSQCTADPAAGGIANAVVELWHCDAEGVYSGFDTFLRGAQTTNADGIARFTSVYPGWYPGRAVHIHIKVHIDKKTVLTTQLFFDDDLTDAVYASTSPYNGRGVPDTRNDTDAVYDPTGLASARRSEDTMLVALNLGIEA